MISLMNACISREAVLEKNIQDPKSILCAMRTTTSYFECKMKLLHKLEGMKSLTERFDMSTDPSNRYKGYHTFPTTRRVRDSFTKGKPLSVFFLNNNHNEAYVSVSLRDRDVRNLKDNDADIAYLTLTYDTENCYTSETGIQFCRFDLSNSISFAKMEDMKITDYAIMLPYMKGDQYINQYTLVYSDWDVLICDKQGVTKGLRKHCVELFNELMNMC